MSEDSVIVYNPEPEVEQQEQTQPDVITLELNELFKYKLLYLAEKYEAAAAVVGTPLKKAFEEQLARAISAAVKEDPECQKWQSERVSCAEELIRSIQSEIPEGYAVSLIAPAEGRIQLTKQNTST